MPRMILGLALWAVLALSVVACRQPPPAATVASAPATEVTVRSGGLELKMRVSSPTVAAGDPLIITFLLRNTGRADRVIRSVSPALFDFAVYGSDGRPIVQPGFSSKPVLTRPAIRVLRPGQAAAASIAWDGTSTVAPGTYLLEGYAGWTAPRTPLLITPRLAIRIRRL